MRIWITSVLLLLVIASVSAATLKGTVYDADLEIEQNVLVEVDTTPKQKFLAKDGTYSFDVPVGTYTIIAQKEDIFVREQVEIVTDGDFVFDLFLFPDFIDEDDLWIDSNEKLFSEDVTVDNGNTGVIVVVIVVIVVVIILAVFTVFYNRRKRKKKTVEQHKEEIAGESTDIDKVIGIIKKHGGRITQKELRKEMIPLSEAKVSLIVTELEHNGKVEKVKKGRGNVIILV